MKEYYITCKVTSQKDGYESDCGLVVTADNPEAAFRSVRYLNAVLSKLFDEYTKVLEPVELRATRKRGLKYVEVE